MTNEPKNPDVESGNEPAMESESPEMLEVHPKDSFHRIIFGQVEEPLFPAPNPPTDTPDDELTRAAMNDPAAHTLDIQETPPTLWRFLVLIALVVGALTIVFWKH